MASAGKLNPFIATWTQMYFYIYWDINCIKAKEVREYNDKKNGHMYMSKYFHKILFNEEHWFLWEYFYLHRPFK